MRALRVLTGWIAAAGMVAALFLLWMQPPSDAWMSDNLRRNRAAFEELVAMIQMDRGLERVDVDWTAPEDTASIGVSTARIADYRRIMERIGVTRGFYAFEPRDQISFLAYAGGISIRGRSKGYVWSKTGSFQDAAVVESLDAAWRSGARRVWGYRHVEGPWYLELRVD
jgi:hypothetical protein